jgi:hypothetical protein
MKYFSLLFLFFMVPVHAQLHEIGFSGGGATLVSDVGTDDYIIPDGYFISGLYRRNVNEWISMVLKASVSRVSENDVLSNSQGRKARGWYSTAMIYDGGILLEYNFLPLNPYKYPEGMWTTPYLVVGMGYYSSSFAINPVPVPEIKGTENAFFLPVGFGLKFSFRNRMKIIWEISAKYSFSDNMEGSYTADNPSAPLTDRRGKDWLLQNGISVTFGWGKLPCYLNTF